MECNAFLSYDQRDRKNAEAVASALKDRDIEVFFDRWYLEPGVPWPQALEAALARCETVAVVIGRHEMGPWQSREASLSLDRQTRDADFRVIPVLLPGADAPLGFLGLQTWVDLRDGITDTDAIGALAAAVQRETVDPAARSGEATVRDSVSPYRGLRPFREEDAPLFLGREAFTELLVEAVGRHSFVSVVGPSGSGKSSVVRAGLVPWIRKGTSGHTWDVIKMVPGRFPISALAAAFLPKLDPEMPATQRLREVPRLADDLARGEIDLETVVESALEQQPGTDRFLLLVDQWEELYTVVANAEEVTNFVHLLLDATERAPLTLVSTMRGDFYGHAIADRALAERLQDGVVNLSTMTRSELSLAVVEPAAAVGLTFEPGLDARILDDVGNEPGNLPLLEFVLDELWSRRSGDTITQDSYDAIGGLTGAIAQRAEEVLKPEDLAIAQAVFLRLVEPGFRCCRYQTAGDTRGDG